MQCTVNCTRYISNRCAIQWMSIKCGTFYFKRAATPLFLHKSTATPLDPKATNRVFQLSCRVSVKASFIAASTPFVCFTSPMLRKALRGVPSGATNHIHTLSISSIAQSTQTSCEPLSCPEEYLHVSQH